MIPMLPAATHADLARNLHPQRTESDTAEPFDESHFAPAWRYQPTPDPLYLALHRFVNRINDLLFGSFHRSA